MDDVLAMSSATDVRCPSCLSVDWYQDGCVIAAVDRAIVAGCTRVQRSDPALRGTSWSCSQCAHELRPDSGLARHLDELRARTCTQP
jgi:hypothetical protein